MPKELDIHSLPESHRRYGDHIQQTKQCQGCSFFRVIVNKDWAPGYDPIGMVCLWGKEWKWLIRPTEKPRACAKLPRPLPVESVAKYIVEKDYVSCGVDAGQFTLPVFSKIVDLYTRIVGGDRLRPGEIGYYYNSIVGQLKEINLADLRLGSFLSGNSKLTIEWRFLSKVSSDQALFFGCYPQAPRRDDQGEYLGSRFDLAVNQYLKSLGIEVPLME